MVFGVTSVLSLWDCFGFGVMVWCFLFLFLFFQSYGFGVGYVGLFFDFVGQGWWMGLNIRGLSGSPNFPFIDNSRLFSYLNSLRTVRKLLKHVSIKL